MMRAQGMVLLITIGMIALIAAMLLSVLHATLLLSKLNQELDDKHHVLHGLEYAAEQFTAQVTLGNLEVCALKTTKHDSCRRDQNRQMYVFDVFDLGLLNNSHHWFIKTRIAQQDHPVLQMRVATAVTQSCCGVEVLSWQLLGYSREHGLA